MSASLVGSEMCIRDSTHDCLRAGITDCGRHDPEHRTVGPPLKVGWARPCIGRGGGGAAHLFQAKLVPVVQDAA
eukprot:1675306-Alexandrium_andersonii.AAC.1